jgi:hypothetical protein
MKGRSVGPWTTFPAGSIVLRHVVTEETDAVRSAAIELASVPQNTER